jgi:hypothetical protein
VHCASTARTSRTELEATTSAIKTPQRRRVIHRPFPERGETPVPLWRMLTESAYVAPPRRCYKALQYIELAEGPNGRACRICDPADEIVEAGTARSVARRSRGEAAAGLRSKLRRGAGRRSGSGEARGP